MLLDTGLRRYDDKKRWEDGLEGTSLDTGFRRYDERGGHMTVIIKGGRTGLK